MTIASQSFCAFALAVVLRFWKGGGGLWWESIDAKEQRRRRRRRRRDSRRHFSTLFPSALEVMMMMMMMCCSISCTAYRQSLFILHHIVDRPKRERREEAREWEKKEKKMMMTVTAISLSLFFIIYSLLLFSHSLALALALALASDSRVRVFIDFARHPTVGYVLTLGKLIKYTLTHALQLDAVLQLPAKRRRFFIIPFFFRFPCRSRDTCFAFVVVVVVVVAFGNPFNLEAIVIARLRLLFRRCESIVLFRGRDRKSSSWTPWWTSLMATCWHRASLLSRSVDKLFQVLVKTYTKSQSFK